MVTVNGTTGVSKVQPNTIGSAEIVDASIAGTDLLTSSGIGYKVGDGGSVTQLTSKATAVTLSKPCGQITMNNAALAAGASVVFHVTNGHSTLGSVICINPVDDFGARYIADIVSTYGGYFEVRVTNFTGTSYSDAIRLNFAIINAVGA